MTLLSTLVQVGLVVLSLMHTKAEVAPLESTKTSTELVHLRADESNNGGSKIEYSLSGEANKTEVKTYQINSILFGRYCFLIRLIVFFNPLYFCPPPPALEVEVPATTNETGTGLSNKFGEDDDGSEPFSSPIDLTPAKPRRKPSRDPPPSDHRLNSTVSASSPIVLTPAKPNREPSQLQPPPQHGSNLNSGRPVVSISEHMPKTKCGLAILRCCKVDSSIVDNECFEQMGCPGPFWDNSPCST